MLQTENAEKETVLMHLEVATVTYRAQDTGYAVLRCRDWDAPRMDTSKVTVTGVFPDIKEGISIFANGEWVRHPRFGMQFRVDSWREELPATESGIRKYLSSGLVYGIGPILADRLVDTFGKETFDVIENHPERLSEVPGVGKKKIESILKRWKDQKAIRDIMVFLKDHGVSDNLAAKIYNKYGDDSISVLRENPYRMADDLWGVGFRTADNMALNLGLEKDAPFRIRSGIKFALEEARNQGHMYLPEDKLASTTAELLGLEPDDESTAKIARHISEMVTSTTPANKLVKMQPGGEVYLPALYEAETQCAEKLLKLAKTTNGMMFAPDIRSVEQSAGLTLAPAQRLAVTTALTHGVTVLTGGPGTGKTTTVRAIIAALSKAGARVLLASPTGKAAKRLEETTGRPAMTIHRLLGFDGRTGHFMHDAWNMLSGDALVVDEASMIDGQLLYFLIRAVPPTMRVILVGDADQLPSVGAGNCLREIIASSTIPTVRLTTIFRQAEGSDIITGAHAINAGYMPNLRGTRDLWFHSIDEPESTAEDVLNIIREAMNAGTPSDDIQVLTPMKRGPIGTEELNRRIQNLVNTNGKVVQKGLRELRVGDRVVNLKNDYDNDVYNGDQGVITGGDEEEGTVTVEYDDKTVVYKYADTDCLLHAWALTIHRSQGSEFPVTIVIMSTQHWIMLQRTLLYTAITRARNLCFIVGSYKAVAQAVRNNDVKHRYTLLGKLLIGD